MADLTSPSRAVPEAPPGAGNFAGMTCGSRGALQAWETRTPSGSDVERFLHPPRRLPHRRVGHGIQGRSVTEAVDQRRVAAEADGHAGRFHAPGVRLPLVAQDVETRGQDDGGWKRAQ